MSNRRIGPGSVSQQRHTKSSRKNHYNNQDRNPGNLLLAAHIRFVGGRMRIPRIGQASLQPANTVTYIFNRNREINNATIPASCMSSIHTSFTILSRLRPQFIPAEAVLLRIFRVIGIV